MTDLRQIVGRNIMLLRTSSKLTQADLATQLNYTDKAISKWERGESVPDVIVLKSIADYFGVTVDYLLHEEHNEKDDKPGTISPEKKKILDRNHRIITVMSITIVWFVAAFAFFLGDTVFNSYLWQAFIVAIPTSLILVLVFNSIWGNVRKNYLIISLLIWTTLAVLYILLIKYNLRTIFLLGIPGEISVILWSRLSNPNYK